MAVHIFRPPQFAIASSPEFQIENCNNVQRVVAYPSRLLLLFYIACPLNSAPIGLEQIDFIMARIATKGLFEPDMEKVFSEAEREAVGKEFEGWVMENFTKDQPVAVCVR